MSVTDIIPDIHGQAEKLRVALENLGWQRTGTSWSHPEPSRQVLFLGDFIDRGPANGAVIRIVRELMDAGRAQAIMGNHELNALHFHTTDPETGLPLRAHETKNMDQHESFLEEFPIGAAETRAVLDWMKNLPLFIEKKGFRAVHAAWVQSSIDDLRAHSGNGTLSEDNLIRSGRKNDALHSIAETLAKGPEQELPKPYSFTDKGNHVRRQVRLKWWNGVAKTWRQVAMSVPDIEQLPDEPLPTSLARNIYPVDERPVFFGHYWMSGTPELQSSNALCLDYSAGANGPLVTYSLDANSHELSLANLMIHHLW